MAQNKKTNFGNTLKLLQDKNALPSATALAALSGVNRQDLAAFAQIWIDLPAERRRKIAQDMVALAEQDFKLDYELLFRHMLNDEDADVRAAGIAGLWESEDAALVKPLIGFLRSDPSANVRAAAADALGRFMLLGEYGRLRDDQAQMIGEALLATTRSDLEDLSVRCRAIESLAYWSNDIVPAMIDAAYEDAEPAMRASAIAAMGRTADTRWRKITQEELASPDPRMRFEAARAAGELENRDAIDQLIELLSDDDREVAGAAVIALGQIGGKTAKAALSRVAQSDDETLVTLATDALQELEFANGSDLLLFDIPGEEDLNDDDDDEEEDVETGIAVADDEDDAYADEDEFADDFEDADEDEDDDIEGDV